MLPGSTFCVVSLRLVVQDAMKSFLRSRHSHTSGVHFHICFPCSFSPLCTRLLFSISLLWLHNTRTYTAGGRSRCAFLVVSTWPECLARGKPCSTVMAKGIDGLESWPDDQNPPLSASTACAGEGENAKGSNDPWSELVRLDTGVIGLEGEVVKPSTQPMERRAAQPRRAARNREVAGHDRAVLPDGHLWQSRCIVACRREKQHHVANLLETEERQTLRNGPTRPICQTFPETIAPGGEPDFCDKAPRRERCQRLSHGATRPLPSHQRRPPKGYRLLRPTPDKDGDRPPCTLWTCQRSQQGSRPLSCRHWWIAPSRAPVRVTTVFHIEFATRDDPASGLSQPSKPNFAGPSDDKLEPPPHTRHRFWTPPRVPSRTETDRVLGVLPNLTRRHSRHPQLCSPVLQSPDDEPQMWNSPVVGKLTPPCSHGHGLTTRTCTPGRDPTPAKGAGSRRRGQYSSRSPTRIVDIDDLLDDPYPDLSFSKVRPDAHTTTRRSEAVA